MALGFEDISAWSTVADNNGNSDNAINFLEHQPRASVNNSTRSVMAAVAKFRDMLNGSIVTGGSANAQTITTPVAFGGSIPTGLRLRVKVGAGLTNTATGLTVSLDGSGAVGVKNMRGQSPSPGEWAAGAYVDMIFDGTYFNMATALPGVFTPSNTNHGRFLWAAPTQCVFGPDSGQNIKVNGQTYNIPSSYVVFNNTATNVNGVSGANLGPNTTYWCGVSDPGSGVLTPQFFNAGGTMHLIDTTLGNVGTHCIINSTVTLVGLVHTNGAAQFQDDAAHRWVLSWFNKQKKRIQGAAMSGVGGPAGVIGDLGAAYYASSLIWGDGRAAPLSVPACFSVHWANIGLVHNVGGDTMYAAIGFDGGSTGNTGQFAAIANVEYSAGCSAEIDAAEGLHTLSAMGGTAAVVGTPFFYGSLVSEVWG